MRLLLLHPKQYGIHLPTVIDASVPSGQHPFTVRVKPDHNLQLSPTFRNEESCEVHSLEMILAIPTSQTPPEHRGTIDVEVQDALVQFVTDPAIKLINIGRHPKLFVGHTICKFGGNTEAWMTARCSNNILRPGALINH